MDQKKIQYALLGGAAILVAAIGIYIYNSSKVEEEEEAINDDIDDQINDLQIEREENGKLTFECFIEIFKLSSKHAKLSFSEKKKEYIAERRAASKLNDDKKYQEIVEIMTQEEEKLINDKLMEIIDKLGISEQEFQENTMYHSRDQTKVMEMMSVQKESLVETETLTKEKCFEVFKVQQELQMKMMEDMVKSQMQGMNANTQEGQMKMMMDAMVTQSKSQDKLFEMTGVEEEQLMSSIQQLKLDKDLQFQQMAQEYMRKAMMKAQQMQGGMGQGGDMMGQGFW